MTLRLFDHDADGIKTFSEVFRVISQFTFLALSVFMVVVEGLTPEDRFTNWEMGLIVTASMGAVVFIEYIKTKNIKFNETGSSKIRTESGGGAGIPE